MKTYLSLTFQYGILDDNLNIKVYIYQLRILSFPRNNYITTTYGEYFSFTVQMMEV